MRYSELNEGPLQRPNLLRNPSRLQTLIKKIETNSPFVLRGEETATVKIKRDPQLIANLKKGIIPDIFPLEDGRNVRLSGLEKTGEFGGKGAGFSTRDEDAALARINEMLEQIKQGKEETNIVIGDKTVPVAKFVTTPGTPKSDFHAVDARGNEVAWVSHKKGSRANDFGQWGGMSDREMKAVYANMPEAKEEILKFAKDVIDMTNGEISRATTYARKIQNGKLRGIAIYGNGFGGERGRQNVDLILQGEPTFKGNRLVATGSTHNNGERLEDVFEPVLMAMYKGDRDNFGVRGARFSIYPAGGRKITKWI